MIHALDPTRRDLRLAYLHEYAHLVVAQQFGGRGFVTVTRVVDADGGNAGCCGRFQMHGDLDDDEWRIVALAGAVAEQVDGDPTIGARELADALTSGALGVVDARLAHGFDAEEVTRCLAIVRERWREIEALAAEHARERLGIESGH